jgi:hypothetical protein
VSAERRRRFAAAIESDAAKKVLFLKLNMMAGEKARAQTLTN